MINRLLNHPVKDSNEEDKTMPSLQSVSSWLLHTPLPFLMPSNRPNTEPLMKKTTEVKSLGKKFKKTHEFIEQLLRAVNLWIEILDREGTVLFWNDTAERTSGYLRQEVLGNDRIWEWAYPDPVYRQTVRKQALQPFFGEPSQDFEATIHTKTGEKRVISWHSQPWIDSHRPIHKLIRVGRDVTQQKHRDQQLSEHADRVRSLPPETGQLLAMAVHELRTPLAAIRGYAALLENEALLPEQKQKVTRILKLTEHLEILITDWLILPRIDAEDAQSVQKEIDFPEVLHEILQTLKPLSKERKQTLHYNRRPLIMITNPDVLKHILTNLLTNAISYTPPGGRITINTCDLGEHVCIEIHDTGIGIPLEDRSRIFEAFYRSETARRMDEKGSGLGLYIVKRFVEGLGGVVQLASPGEGQGSTFTLTLPKVHKQSIV